VEEVVVGAEEEEAKIEKKKGKILTLQVKKKDSLGVKKEI
jgi:hypothetical protein